MRKESQIEKILAISSIIIILTSIIVRIIMYIKCRSLWLDEAMLAESIVSRNWLELLASPLSNNQSAPVLYVIAVKLICSILGYSEFSLRFFSFLSFLGLLFCEFIFLRKVFNFNNIKIAFVLTITAVLPAYIWYSNELKPYMSDAFFVLLTILLYFYYTKNKVNITKLTIFYLLIIGFCSPAIFFIGGILSTEFFIAILQKDRRKIFKTFISGIIIVVMFALYYIWWMQPVSEVMEMFWGNRHKEVGFVKETLRIFSTGAGNSGFACFWIFVPFALFGIYYLVKQKNNIAYSICLSMFLLLIASLIGKWPITGRLWLFLPTIVLILVPFGFEFVLKDKKIPNKIILGLFLSIIIGLFVNCLKYADDKMYFQQEEANRLISYVRQNIKDDEKLYVYPMAKYIVMFKNGYYNNKIGTIGKDNIIYGINVEEWNELEFGAELDTIVKSQKAYLLFHHTRMGIDSGLVVLHKYGTVNKVMEFQNTPLYYFQTF